MDLLRKKQVEKKEPRVLQPPLALWNHDYEKINPDRSNMDKRKIPQKPKASKNNEAYRALGLLAESIRILAKMLKLLQSNSIGKDFFGSVSEIIFTIIKIILGL